MDHINLFGKEQVFSPTLSVQQWYNWPIKLAHKSLQFHIDNMDGLESVKVFLSGHA